MWRNLSRGARLQHGHHGSAARLDTVLRQRVLRRQVLRAARARPAARPRPDRRRPYRRRQHRLVWVILRVGGGGGGGRRRDGQRLGAGGRRVERLRQRRGGGLGLGGWLQRERGALFALALLAAAGRHAAQHEHLQSVGHLSGLSS